MTELRPERRLRSAAPRRARPSVWSWLAILLTAGTFDQDLSQIVVDKDITLIGQGQGVSTIQAAFDTGSSGAVSVRP